jgi:uncharacterized radical SAM superfamily protein
MTTEPHPDLNARLRTARELSWHRFGKSIGFYLPGIFSLDGHTGRYPAVSITGSQCALECDHCQGRILTSMADLSDPQRLITYCLRLAHRGALGLLISGGCDSAGKLPWAPFLPAIRQIKQETGLFISVHSGLVDEADARGLKDAGVDQALIDLIGDDDTLRQVYHLPFGVERIEAALAALVRAGLPTIPHIVCGLHYGAIRGEHRAIEMLKPHAAAIPQLVFVSLMGIPRTPMWKLTPPTAESVAGLIAEARLALPDTLLSLGCARQRGNVALETLAIDAGLNRLALPSEEAMRHAEGLGLAIAFQQTCCSVTTDIPAAPWYRPGGSQTAQTQRRS